MIIKLIKKNYYYYYYYYISRAGIRQSWTAVYGLFFDRTYSLNLYREIRETVSLLTLRRSHWAFRCGELVKPNLKIELFQTEIPWCG